MEKYHRFSLDEHEFMYIEEQLIMKKKIKQLRKLLSANSQKAQKANQSEYPSESKLTTIHKLQSYSSESVQQAANFPPNQQKEVPAKGPKQTTE